ncbi:hypothetical protein BN1050_02424 [Metalysinibacillus saudimassiliensis]|uniref:Uncharacterized protein n=1 Tax=Metalysinibacillus saudimassiliensis TaxID=1461583 RepID=A0A078MGE5_9BACL|nr:hypothetical protein BN1050_02424 [Metalysinibacillus saudimassiliensis]
MFNGALKKEAIAMYKERYQEYEIGQTQIVTLSEELQQTKVHAKSVVEKAWDFLNSFRNTPEDLQLTLNEIQIEYKKFENTILSIQKEFDKNLQNSAGLGAAGVVAGAGVAALGPAAAMSVAMTFGTASTGAAISGLGGAAATNAALAWLGGGALAAGGGGMAGGSAFLALAGPVGWAIGGTAIAGAGLMARGKNKKIADEAFEKAKELHEQTTIMKITSTEISEVASLINNNSQKLMRLKDILVESTFSYNQDMALIQKQPQLMNQIGTLVNNTKSLAKLLNRTIGAGN